MYGVSTGFGALDKVDIAVADRERLQHSLVRSHVAGAGPLVEREVVLAMMLLRLHTLATGRTGVRIGTVRAYADLLSAGITLWCTRTGRSDAPVTWPRWPRWHWP